MIAGHATHKVCDRVAASRHLSPVLQGPSERKVFAGSIVAGATRTVAAEELIIKEQPRETKSRPNQGFLLSRVLLPGYCCQT